METDIKQKAPKQEKNYNLILGLSLILFAAATICLSVAYSVAVKKKCMTMATEVQAPGILINPITVPATANPGVPQVVSLSFQQHIDNTRLKDSDLVLDHEKLMHFIIIGEDLNTFAHVHLEDFSSMNQPNSGTFSFRGEFPNGGTYLIATDFVTTSGHYSKHFPLRVTGGATTMTPRTTVADTKRSKLIRPVMVGVGGVNTSTYAVRSNELSSSTSSPPTPGTSYNVTLEGIPSRVPSDFPIPFTFRIQQDGADVTNLDYYMGAGMHLLVVREGLSSYTHAHGDFPSATPATPAADEHGHSMGPTLQQQQQLQTNQKSQNLQHQGAATTGQYSIAASDNTAGAVLMGPVIQGSVSFAFEGMYTLIGQIRRGSELIVVAFDVVVA